MTAPFDIRPFLASNEGQHFDRKSLLEGPPGSKQPRDRKAVRDQIAEYVAAFANAEGGVLLLGIENDGTVTGHAYPENVVDEMLRAPEGRLVPAGSAGERVSFEGKEVLVFDVPAADAPVMVIGNGYPLRIGDATVKATEPQIRAMKLQGLAESWESRSNPTKLSELDLARLAIARAGGGLADLADDVYLVRRKLADRRGGNLVLRNAADLLFAEAPEHPNAGVRVFRVVGTERRVGSEYNVEEVTRLEGPLASVIEQGFSAIGRLLRRPTRLVGRRFVPMPEYPEGAWREVLLNAIAHRDYGVQGRAVEVTLFDDRMEVTSPGGLVPGVVLEQLRQRERVHQSRNPRIVRVLVDLGYMRDQGEGIPRVFSEMEGQFLPDPELVASDHEFKVTLRNTPTLTGDDRDFLASIDEDLSPTELHALLEARRKGRVDNATMRALTGLDTLRASRILGGLRDRGHLVMHPAGAKTYFELSRPDNANGGGLQAPELSNGGGLDPNGGGLEAPELSNGGGLDPNGGGLEAPVPSNGGGLETPAASVGGELAPGPEGEGRIVLSDEERAAIDALGPKPRSGRVREVLFRLLADWRTGRELARALKRDQASLTEKYLGPMVQSGELVRKYDEPSHPQQAYRVAHGPLFAKPAGTSDDEETP